MENKQPKSKPAPYKANAKSWKAQGFGDVVRGIDISMWQHPNGKPINFAKLKKDQKLKFVIIKASDGGTRGNENAKKWFASKAVILLSSHAERRNVSHSPLPDCVSRLFPE